MDQNTLGADFGPSDEYINTQAAAGRKTYDRVRTGKPQFGFPDISSDQVDRDKILNLLLGASAGARASQDAASPFGALAMGLGGGVSAPQAGDIRAKRQAVQNQLTEEQINLTPVEHISPGIVQAYPELQGVPVGVIQKITPLLQTQEKAKQAQMMFTQNAALRRELASASPAIQALFEVQNGLPAGSLRSLKASEEAALKDQAGKPLSAELLKLKENANDGIKSLTNALSIFDKAGQSTKTLGAYGGPGGDVLRATDEQAQELRRELLKATDVVTRIRTGAALNQQEQVFYNGLVNKVLQSNGQNRKSMVDLLNFYQKINSDIDSGKRNSGLGAIAGDPVKVAALAKRLGIDPSKVDMAALAPAPAPAGEIRKKVQTKEGIKTGVWSAEGKFLRYE